MRGQAQLEDLLTSLNSHLDDTIKFHALFTNLDSPIQFMNASETAKIAITMDYNDSNEQNTYLYCIIPLCTLDDTLIIDGIEYTPEKFLIFKEDIRFITEEYEKNKKQIKKNIKKYERNLNDFGLFYVNVNEEIKKIILNEIKDTPKEQLVKKLKEHTLNQSRLLNYIKNLIHKKHFFSIVDFTNPLARIESIRRIRFADCAYIKINNANGLEKRDRNSLIKDLSRQLFIPTSDIKNLSGRNPHPSHIGKLCIIETPESERIGYVLHLALPAKFTDFNPYNPKLENLDLLMTTQSNTETNSEESNKSQIQEANDNQSTTYPIKTPEEISLDNACNLFGYAALQIPFVNHNDPARALMGSKNLKQALPVKDAEIPLIKTGFEDKIFTDNLSIVRSPIDGIVKDIQKDKIIIFNQNEEIEQPILNDYHSVMTNVGISHKPIIKVGSTVKKGEPISYLDGIIDGMFAPGVNLLVAYMPYKGLNMDDAIVISESAAKKFTSTHIFKYDVNIPDNAEPTFNENTIKENQKVKPSDILTYLIYNTESLDELFLTTEPKKIFPEEIQQESLSRIKKDFNLNYEDFLKLLNDTTFFSNIVEKIETKQVNNKFNEDTINKLKKIKTKQNYQQKNLATLNILYPDLISLKKIAIKAPKEYVGTIFLKKKRMDPEHVSFWFKKFCHLSVGDKLMGRHGNKGVISKILPDNEMPQFCINGKKYRVDIILNPLGVISRMNIGQLLETHFGFIAMHHPDPNVREIARNSGAPFSKIDFDKLSTWLNECGLDNSGKIKLCLNCNSDCNNSQKTTNPVTVGYQYFLKLNHIAELKLTSRGIQGRESLKTGMPLRGGHQSGQRLGEMETWALISHGEINLLKELFTHRSNYDYNLKHTRSLQSFKDYLKGLGIDFLIVDPSSNEDDNKPQYMFKYNSNIRNYGNQLNTSIQNLWNESISDNDLDKFFHILLPNGINFLDYLSYIPIVPQRLRPQLNDKLNRYYNIILLLINQYSKNKIKFEELQERITKLGERIEKAIESAIKGKRALIRGAILGKRITLSGRAVIVPDPTLPPYVTSLPKEIIKTLQLNKDQYSLVLLNRQPTLHPHNIQIFEYIENQENVIKINPLVCKPFNADFDGDTMSVYAIDPKHLTHDSILAQNQLFSSALSKILLNISQDILMGCYLLEEHEIKDFIQKYFPNCPEKIKSEISNEYSKDKNIEKIVDKIVESYYLLNHRDTRKTMDFMHKLMEISLDKVTNYGLTLSIYDFLKFRLEEDEINNLLDDAKKGSDSLDSDFKKEIDNIIVNKLKNKGKSLLDNPISLMLNSRARGSWDNVRQIAASRGNVEITDINGKTTQHPVWIRNGYLNGLTPMEYFIASYGARKSLADKKLMTPHCGYLTRRLVYVASDIIIKEKDCNSQDYIEIDKKYALGRYALINVNNEEKLVLIDEQMYAKINEIRDPKNNKIKVRSPLKCKVKGGICQVCYGWELGQRRIPDLGFHAGILSATVIGERATQDAMKTFHTAKATKTLTSFDKTKRIFDGKIRLSLKWIEKIIDILFCSIYSEKVDRKHFEVIARAVFRDLFDNNMKTIRTSTKLVINTIGNKLHQIAFENPLETIKKIAKEQTIYEPKTIIEELFLL